MPKAGSALRIYNYADYLSPRVIKYFEKKYGVDVQLSTFNDADEALTKIASERARVRPLLPELRLARQAGPGRPGAAAQPTTTSPTTPTSGRSFTDPWYDRGARYTIPYTVYTHRASAGAPTWRVDLTAWTTPTTSSGTPKYSRQHGDPRRLAHRDGDGAAAQRVQDINSTNPKDLAIIARRQLLDLRKTMNPKVTISMYSDMPAGQYGLRSCGPATRSTRPTTCRRT